MYCFFYLIISLNIPDVATNVRTVSGTCWSQILRVVNPASVTTGERLNVILVTRRPDTVDARETLEVSLVASVWKGTGISGSLLRYVIDDNLKVFNEVSKGSSIFVEGRGV